MLCCNFVGFFIIAKGYGSLSIMNLVQNEVSIIDCFVKTLNCCDTNLHV